MRTRWFFVFFAVLSLSGVVGGGDAVGLILGSSAEERAVNGAKAYLARQGEKTVVLSVVVPRRYAKAVLKEIQEFEQKTGVIVRNFVEVDESALLGRLREEAASKTGRVDLILAPPRVVPEAAEARVLLALDDFIREGRPDLKEVAPLFRAQGRYRGKTYGLFANGEMLVLAIRRDLTTLRAERSAFKRKYGWEPDCPDTWKQWRQLAEFYTRESKDGKFSKYYGASGVRSLSQGWRWWLQRYYSKGKLPFDEWMNPTLDSRKGVETTKEYIEIVKYMPDESTTWTPEEGVASFMQGNVFSILTHASAVHTIKNSGNSTVGGKVKFCMVPGSLVEGGPFRRAMQAGAAVWLVSRYSRYPEAGYWLAQWLTSSRVSAEWVAKPRSNFSPHQRGHFKHPKITAAYTPELIRIIARLTQVVVPEILLMGADEYHEALARHLFGAVTGSLSPEEAMKQTAAKWTEITERIGRKRQMSAWESFLRGLPKRDFPE